MSNSIGNLKNSGLKGNNWPWQYKVLLGLDKIAASIATGGSEYEAELVNISCPGPVPPLGDIIRLEVRVFDTTTGSFTTVQYYEPGSIVPDPTDYSTCTITYITGGGGAAGGATEATQLSVDSNIVLGNLTLNEIDTVLDTIKTDTAYLLGIASVLGLISTDISAMVVEQLAQGLSLDSIVTETTLQTNELLAINAQLTPTLRVPLLQRLGLPGGFDIGSIATGKRSVSFLNAGPVDITVATGTLKPGESITFDAGGQGDTLGPIPYSLPPTADCVVTSIT